LGVAPASRGSFSAFRRKALLHITIFPFPVSSQKQKNSRVETREFLQF
jgi:hypothetical protein